MARFSRFGQPAIDYASRIIPGYGGDAVALTSQVTLNPGDSLDLSADALRNGVGESLQIDTLRWTIDAQQQVESADPPTSAIGMPGGGVEISISFGGNPITAGEVPIYCLGTSVGQDVEHAILGVADDTNTEMLLGAYAGGIWEFDHPLTVDANETFSVHLTHHGLQNLPVVVSLSLTGRAGRELPRSRWLPYVASWKPPAFDPHVPTAASPSIETSTERDLVNRINGKLHVSRFIGRLLRLGVTGAPLGGASVIQNNERVFPSVEEGISGQPTTEWFPGAVDSFVTISMRDSRANDNIPAAQPFRMVFEPESHAWECPHVLDENGYYIAQITLSVPAVLDASVQPSIAMIGSWEGK
jgi:hypothetical protein